jgi:4-hydroxy-2-oxoheptanedioate aldolase
VKGEVNGSDLKEALRGGDVRVGAILKIPSPDLVELLCRYGLDFVIADAEHGPTSPETCQQMVRAAEAAGTPLLVRLGEGDPGSTVTRFLDTGVAGVHLPRIRSPETARDQIALLSHPPTGVRGLAGGRWAAYGAGAPLPSLVARVEASLAVVLQIEDLEGCANVPALVGLDEVDVYFVGPTDLAASMGLRGDKEAPAVREQVDSTLRTIIAAGKTAGILAATPAEAEERVAFGVRYIVFNAESMLRWGVDSGLRSVRGAGKRAVP